jgi:UDP-N-acetylglucosamine--N-acetylmuramyl-(pentapeptide) pyrophosphoryl-undecaprenol N-acetylglucosamine transferase
MNSWIGVALKLIIMKILFTGGGTGGHFYPIIAIAKEINDLSKENRLIDVELFFMSSSPYNEGLLFENNITFRKNIAGKIRRAPGIINKIKNFFDLFRIGWGTVISLWEVYKIYPDVIFGKGGYASFPALLAGKLLRIPVVIHESDSAPGKVNAWAAKFATRIAISYPESAKYFSQSKVALTGCPVRQELQTPLTSGAFEFLDLDPNIPTLLILGGSQGAQRINDAIVDALPKLLNKYQVIHQTGKNNIALVKETANAVLLTHPHQNRYKPFDYLNLLALRMSAGASKVVISRAGSAIFEIASWHKPSIIIPIPLETSHDQTSNAFSYARSGACVVIEEKNLSSNIIIAEIDRILEKPGEADMMIQATESFNHPDAARKIATEILNIALTHSQ